MNCRICRAVLDTEVLDLGTCPPSNSYLKKSDLDNPEIHYPLKVMVCSKCWLVQTKDFVSREELFHASYAYLSSVSKTWLKHSELLVEFLQNRFNLDRFSKVLEVASNDGYLLQYFKDKNIECLGIEPTLTAASIARAKGIETITEFFGRSLALKLAKTRGEFDIIIANNVLAHVPDLNDFVDGISLILKAEGVAVLEFPSLRKLIDKNQFDTIYHEHYSYFSLVSADRLMNSHNLEIFDFTDIDTHGGSLRIFCKLKSNDALERSDSVYKRLEEETKLNNQNYYLSLQHRVEKVKVDFIKFLVDLKVSKKTVCGYGAAAKGNTLLNYCGIGPDLLAYIVDKNEEKCGLFTPGGRIPILATEVLGDLKPDVIIILPWNLKEEIAEQLKFTRSWGAELVVVQPEITVLTN